MRTHFRRAAALFVLTSCASTLAQAAVSGQGAWEATLQARYFDNNATALGITWLGDANYAKTSGYDADGQMSWTAANVWAAGLNFDGITGWRLPTTIDADVPMPMRWITMAAPTSTSIRV